MTRQQIEKKYGVAIRDDSYYNPVTNREVKQYRMYSADGCAWENGLRTIKAVEEECRKWELELLAIKRTADMRRAVR